MATYQAFISYQHAADARLAAAVQQGLHRFAQPYFSRRVINVFRDETGLAANPALWPSIEERLKDAAYLLLFACPESAASHWVQREIEWWLGQRDPARILVVLSGGDIVWDDAAHDFDWARTTALPRSIAGRFTDLPLYVDLRWARSAGATLTLRHTRFRAAVLDLSATLRGVRKEDLDGDDVRRQRRRRSATALAASAIATLAVVAAWKAHEATTQRDEAQRRRQVSVAQALAAQAVNEFDAGDPELAALLARQAYLINERHHGERLAEADAALRHVLGSPGFYVRLADAAEAGPAAASADGRWLVVAGADHVRLWDLQEGDHAPRVLAHGIGPIRAVAFSATTGALLAVSSKGDLLRWPAGGAGSATRLALPAAREAELMSFGFDPAAATLAAGTSDGRVLVWPLEPQAAAPQVICCASEGTAVGAVALAGAPGGWIAAGDERGRLAVWDPARPEAPVRSTRREHRVRALAFSPDASLLAIGTDRGIRQDLLHGGVPAEDAALAPVGGTIALWPMAASSEPRDIGSHASGVTALVFSRDGQHLTSGAEGDPVVRAWLITGGAPATGRALRHGTGLKGLVWSGDGRFLATSDLGDRRSAGPTLRLWHMAAMPAEPQEIHRSAAPVRALAIDAAESVLAIASPVDGGLWLWDLKAAKLRSPLAGADAGAVAVAIDAAGRRLAAAMPAPLAGGVGSVISIWNLQTLPAPPVAAPGHGSEVRALAFNSSAGLLVSGGSEEPELRLWTSDGRAANPAVLHAGDQGVLAVAAHPRRAEVAWGGRDGKVRRADLPSGLAMPLAVASLAAATPVQALAYSGSGALLAAAADDGRIRLWRSATPDALATVLEGHAGPVFALAFGQTDRPLVSGGRDGTLRLWDPTRPADPPIVLKVDAEVYAVVLDAAGGSVVSGDNKGRVLVWLGTAQLARSVCTLVRRELSDAEWLRFAGSGVERAATCPVSAALRR